MTGPDAIQIIQGLGISQAKLGRLIGVSATAVSKWANGGPPSKPAATLLLLLQARPELIEVLQSLNAGRKNE